MSIELNKPEYTVKCTGGLFREVGWGVFREEYIKYIFGIVRMRSVEVYWGGPLSTEECEAVAKTLREYNK